MKAGRFKPFKAVFWAFFGVRKKTDNDADFAGVSPVHILTAGVIGAAIFVGVLVTLVKTIVG